MKEPTDNNGEASPPPLPVLGAASERHNAGASAAIVLPLNFDELVPHEVAELIANFVADGLSDADAETQAAEYIAVNLQAAQFGVTGQGDDGTLALVVHFLIPAGTLAIQTRKRLFDAKGEMRSLVADMKPGGKVMAPVPPLTRLIVRRDALTSDVLTALALARENMRDA